MWRGTVILGLLSALVGCAAPAPNLGIIYKQEAAQTKKVPIVMIPGFPGSVLEEKNLRTGETRRLWGSVIAILDRTRFDDLEMRIDAKAIEDMGDPRANPERDPENRTVKAVDVIGEFTFFTRSVGVYDAYEGMLDMLIKDAGYHLASTEDFRNKADGRNPRTVRKNLSTPGNLFVFFYDWRRDNIEHACELAVLVERIKEALGVEKVNLIAHSNGGLVARYYLRYGGKDVLKGRDCPLGGPEVNQPGAYSVHRLVTLGTPNGGSAKIVYYLANGADFAPWIRDLSKRVLFTMPGAYQLMPYGLNPDGSYAWLYEPDTWIRLVGGKEMAPKERGFLSAVLERAKAFREFLGPDAYGRSEEESVKRLLVIGDCFDTDDLSRQGDTLKYDTVPGDRTVTRRSAQQIAAPANLQVLYGCVEHGGLQRDPVLMNNVLKTMFEP